MSTSITLAPSRFPVNEPIDLGAETLQFDKVVTLDVSGKYLVARMTPATRADDASLDQFVRCMQQLKGSNLIVDMSQAAPGSSDSAVLLGCFMELRRGQGDSFTLIGVPADFKQVLDTTKTSSLFNLHSSEESALKNLDAQFKPSNPIEIVNKAYEQIIAGLRAKNLEGAELDMRYLGHYVSDLIRDQRTLQEGAVLEFIGVEKDNRSRYRVGISRLDEGSLPDKLFDESLEEKIVSTRGILLDLSKLEHLGATAVGSLLRLNKLHIERHGSPLEIVDARPEVQATLKRMRLA